MSESVTVDYLQTLLSEYEKDICADGRSYGRINLESLIGSHRSLRELNIKHRNDYNTNFQQVKELGAKAGYDEVVSRDYVKVQDLKAMTIMELVKFLADLED